VSAAAAGGGVVAFDPVMRSPLQRTHENLGATFGRDGDWAYPARYAEATEARGRYALTDGVAVTDISARGMVDVRGAIGGLFTRIARLSEGWQPGEIVPLEPAPSEEYPGFIAPISDIWAILFCPPASVETRLEELEAPVAEGLTMVTEVSSQYSGMALFGPRAFDVLARATEFDLAELEPGTAVATRMLEINGMLLHRDLGHDRTVVELWVSSSYARYAWETVLAIGGPHGAAPVGRDALSEQGWW
jgi:glycine cleavage system aminomethyltransferase T